MQQQPFIYSTGGKYTDAIGTGLSCSAIIPAINRLNLTVGFGFHITIGEDVMTWYASDGLTSQQLSATHGSGAGMEYIFNLTVSKKLPQPINLTSYSVNGWTENSYDGKIQ